MLNKLPWHLQFQRLLKACLGTHSLQNTGLNIHEIRLKFLKIQFPLPQHQHLLRAKRIIMKNVQFLGRLINLS